MPNEALREKLISIETRKIVESLSWADIEQGINSLTQDDKERIAKSITGGGENIRPLIDSKLAQFVTARAASVVDAFIAGNSQATLDYVARMIE